MTLARFTSMGCEVAACRGDAVAVREVFARYDRTFSRFLPDSELCHVNRCAARAPVVVSSLFADVLGAALAAADGTDGLNDPTVGGAVRAAGYARTFAAGLDSREPAGAPRPGCLGGVQLIGRVVRLAEGVELDLNGIVKALAIDEALAASGARWVAAGGDVAVAQPLDVGLPASGSVRVLHGGLATSGTVRRRWRRAGTLQHHLIDPRTGSPAQSPWEQVTACGRTCLDADLAARSAFLLGRAGPGWLDERGVPGRFLAPDAAPLVNATWREMAGAAA